MADAKCTFYVHIPIFDTTYTLKKISKTYMIKELQARIELVCGIPVSVQRLYYLDKAELHANRNLLTLDIVNKATFTLHIWEHFVKLLKSIFFNNISEFKSHLDSWTKHRELDIFLDVQNVEKAKVSVFLAAHLGHIELLKLLRTSNVELDSQTQCGHTPLHAAIATGKYQCIDFLLDCGAQFEKNSIQSQNATLIGRHNGHNDSDRHIYLFNWQSRAKKQLREPVKHYTPLMVHQQFDSGNKTWIDGEYSTRYMCASLPRKDNYSKKMTSYKQQKIEDDKLPPIITSSDQKKESTEKVFNEWVQKKKEQKLYEAEKKRQEKVLKDLEKAEKEKKRRYSQRKVEHDRKNRAAREDVEKAQKRTNIYEDFSNRPCYGRSIISQLISEIGN